MYWQVVLLALSAEAVPDILDAAMPEIPEVTGGAVPGVPPTVTVRDNYR